MSPIVDATLRVSVVVLVALGVTAVLTRRSAALRHWILMVGIACAAGTPLLQLALPSWHVAPARWVTGAPAPQPAADVTTAVVVRLPEAADRVPQAATRPARVGTPLPALLVSMWLAGVLANVCLLIAALRRLSRSASAARPVVSGRLFSIAADVRHAFGLRRRVRLLQSRTSAPLATWGVFRPTLLLPADAHDWSEHRARIVLRHELAHVARCDWAAQMVAETLRAVLWFNPLVWLASRRLRHESERACDDVVIGSGVAPADYASHLLELARCAGRGTGRPALAMARPSSLEGRIRAMLRTNVNHGPLNRASRITALVVFAALAVPLAAAQARFWSFSGSVVDPTDRPVPDVAVVLSNEAARAKFEVRTDAAGRFEFQALAPGDYALTVVRPGFKVLKEAVSIAGSDASRTLRLQVGTVNESITVAGLRPGTPAAGGRGTGSGAVESERLARSERARAEARKAVSERCEGAAAGQAGGAILPPMKLVDVRPDYPEALNAAGVAGVVTLDAVIGTDGAVHDVKVVSSPHPELNPLATEAVRQWEFSPTYLNCTPIDVEMRVTISFGTVPKKRP